LPRSSARSRRASFVRAEAAARPPSQSTESGARVLSMSSETGQSTSGAGGTKRRREKNATNHRGVQPTTSGRFQARMTTAPQRSLGVFDSAEEAAAQVVKWERGELELAEHILPPRAPRGTVTALQRIMLAPSACCANVATCADECREYRPTRTRRPRQLSERRGMPRRRQRRTGQRHRHGPGLIRGRSSRATSGPTPGRGVRQVRPSADIYTTTCRASVLCDSCGCVSCRVRCRAGVRPGALGASWAPNHAKCGPNPQNFAPPAAPAAGLKAYRYARSDLAPPPPTRASGLRSYRSQLG